MCVYTYGRPELLVGEAIFASESVPLGRATGLPQGWAPLTTQFFDELTSLLGTITSEKGDGVVAADEAMFSSAKAPLRSVTSLATRTGKKVSSVTTLASLSPAGDWAATTTGTVTLPGAARALDADPATGEVLLAATDCKGRRCLTRFVHVDPSGRVLATATYRGDDDEPAGYFVADGNDADVLPEVVLRPRGEEWTSRLPLWRSTAGNAKVSALPELAARGKPIVAEGPSVAWKRDGAPAGLVVIGAANRRSGNAPLMVVTPE